MVDKGYKYKINFFFDIKILNTNLTNNLAKKLIVSLVGKEFF